MQCASGLCEIIKAVDEDWIREKTFILDGLIDPSKILVHNTTCAQVHVADF